METGAKVKLRGVQVGRVSRDRGGGSGPHRCRCKLEIDPDQIKYIPANVEAQIRATTVFGAKFVDLVYPDDPSPQRLAAGQVLQVAATSAPRSTRCSRTWSACSTRSTPPSSTACCRRWPTVSAARASGSARPPPTPIRCCWRSTRAARPIRADWQALKGFSDTYGAAAQDILTTLERGEHHQRHHHQPRQGAGCVAAGHHWAVQQRHQPAGAEPGQPDQGHQRAGADDRTCCSSTTPSTPACWSAPSTCWTTAATRRPAATARSLVLDAGSVARRRPVPLPGQPADHRRQGRPGRQAGLRFAARSSTKNWPVRQLVTNTGFGTGVDWRPNPGIGFPAYANYLPVDPRGARTAEHPQPVRRARARADPVPGRPGLRCAAVRARRHAAVAGPAARAAARAPRDPGPTPGRSRSWCRARAACSRRRCRRSRSRSRRRRRRDPEPPTPTTTDRER